MIPNIPVRRNRNGFWNLWHNGKHQIRFYTIIASTKFQNEILENVCSIRFPTRNIRNIWSIGKSSQNVVFCEGSLGKNHRFWRFYFSVYSLVFVSIEKLYQTLVTVFHRPSKHREFSQKYSAAHRIFNYLLGVWISR